MSSAETVSQSKALSDAEIFAEVVRLAAAQGGADPQSVTAQTHFQNDLCYDSLDKVEFVMELEERFEIAIPDELAERTRTVADAFEHVQTLLGRKTPLPRKEGLGEG